MSDNFGVARVLRRVSVPAGSIDRSTGFTLIELLVAVGIFVVLSALAYGGLNAVMRQRAYATEVMDRVNELQFFMRRLGADLQQLHPRPVREELGEELAPALRADVRREYVFELTRAGWGNPFGLPRSTLQRVAYRREEDKLIRAHWGVLDRTQLNEPIEVELLSGLEDLTLRFLDENREWHDEWPLPDLPVAEQQRMLPLAIEIVLLLEDHGEITRLIEIGT